MIYQFPNKDMKRMMTVEELKKLQMTMKQLLSQKASSTTADCITNASLPISIST
jgi:hypothetical protein